MTCIKTKQGLCKVLCTPTAFHHALALSHSSHSAVLGRLLMPLFYWLVLIFSIVYFSGMFSLSEESMLCYSWSCEIIQCDATENVNQRPAVNLQMFSIALVYVFSRILWVLAVKFLPYFY